MYLLQWSKKLELSENHYQGPIPLTSDVIFDEFGKAIALQIHPY